jgi:hypothetical protein
VTVASRGTRRARDRIRNFIHPTPVFKATARRLAVGGSVNRTSDGCSGALERGELRLRQT